ncbi:MAG: agmatinase [Deltaproteobacteria bacterium RIFOXYD12_FULL_50_9]|nr:MAG: agmatinase [Deltaproteobacteria bacterium RIFOXYD12_FULL_50_9]
MDKYQFLDEDEAHFPEKRVSFISAPLANTVSWGKGTEEGPHAIMEASWALESFDDALALETFRVGFETMPPLALQGLSSQEACEEIRLAVDCELARKRLPVLLGGEHTVTLPAVNACQKYYPDLHVVQLDAHLDLRNEFESSPLSHACVMRRISDLDIPFTQIGIRSFSKEEWKLVQDRGWQPFFMQRIRQERDWMAQVCATLTGSVYLSIDVDVLDPAVMPATGTPEPDGLSWAEVSGLIECIAKARPIVGLDLVEFAPCPGGHHAAFSAAKLLYRTLGYMFRNCFDY